ncbi:MAG: hypothetical protein LCI00_08180 [Chloroflexi bacterium]|nr:hypothetical protein [Chloroflexota bacterium]
MMDYKLQIVVGGFALMTLLLAGTAVGRVLGMGFDEALYLTGLLLVVLGWVGNSVMLRCSSPPIDEPET